MIRAAIKCAAIAAMCTALGTPFALAEDTPTEGDAAATSDVTVKGSALVLKDAEDIPFSAQQLRPIALDSLPKKIDLDAILSTIPGSAVSAEAQALRDLDRADVPAAARALRGTAGGALPGPASSRTTGARTPSLPSAARGRGPH